MDQPVGFVLEGTRGVYRPVAAATFQEGVARIQDAIGFASSIGIKKLLIDLTRLPTPNTIERYTAATMLATEARGRVRVAFVTRPEMIDPEKFEVLVATNLGFTCEVFSTEAEALGWLETGSSWWL